jgi:glutathione S-transferase
MVQPDISLHGTLLSGHTHRVELLLRMLGVPFKFVETPAAVRQTAEFRALNPLGQIPVLKDGDLVLADSNAILVYLAKKYGQGTQWLPEDPIGASRVQRWLSIAAGEVKYGPGNARLITLWQRPGDVTQAREIAGDLLRFMEGHLSAGGGGYLAAGHATLADLACYSYVSHAPEGRISLEPFPTVRAWIRRVEALPGFLPMPASEIPPEQRR